MSSTALIAANRRSRPRLAKVAVATAIAGSLLLAACGSEGNDLGGTVVEDGLGCTVTEVDRRADDAPTIEAVDEVGETTSSTDVTEADEDACSATTGQYLTVDLIGATAADGEVFTSTWEDGQPITLQLGAGQLITGLETGLADMPVGSRRQIVVPAAEAYGTDGYAEQGIGPDEDLVYVVDLISLTDAPVYCNRATNIPEGTREGKPTEVEMPLEAPTEVKTTVLVEGEGEPITADQYLTVEYVGISCATGQEFDSSWGRDEPITIALTDAEPTATYFQVIPGWSTGLVGQKLNSTVQVDIPSDDAYGAAGSPPAIGPNDPLTFIVQITKVEDTASDAVAETTTTVPAG